MSVHIMRKDAKSHLVHWIAHKGYLVDKQQVIVIAPIQNVQYRRTPEGNYAENQAVENCNANHSSWRKYLLLGWVGPP